MSAIGRLLKKFAALVGRARFDGGLEEEMVFHREQIEEELRAVGMSAEEARYAARRQFGNTARLKEQSHEVVRFRLETVAQDVRFVVRQMQRNPGFAVTAVLMLALGMGASTAIFGFVDAALIR
ncbi:MAG TPA: permease prefix domain 1-containing protein, partial [Terriglobia bacterium]|nr:permease prefix domain 1-containing protein [Terriglobia bacterium]